MGLTYYAADLCTGDVLTELPLTGFSGRRHLSVRGEMETSVALRGFSRSRRRELRFATTPGRSTIVAVDGAVVRGEWIIWKRPVTDDGAPLGLYGAEFLSYLDYARQMPGLSYPDPGTDQATIAVQLARWGFWRSYTLPAPAGAVSVNIPDPTLTGRRRVRRYAELDGTVGQRLSELGAVIDGFDLRMDTRMSQSGPLSVVRTLTVEYPMAGRDTAHQLDRAGIGGRGGAVTALSVTEDATKIGSDAYVLGAGEGPDKVIGRASSTVWVSAGWPRMDVVRSFSSVKSQGIANGHAAALLDRAQDITEPPQITIRADGDPSINELIPGDRVWVSCDPSINFPDGYSGYARIIGWTLQPPQDGPELVQIEFDGLGLREDDGA